MKLKMWPLCSVNFSGWVDGALGFGKKFQESSVFHQWPELVGIVAFECWASSNQQYDGIRSLGGL